MHLDVRERLHAVAEAARSSSAWRSVKSSRAWVFLCAFAVKSKEDRVPGLTAETAFFVVLGINGFADGVRDLVADDVGRAIQLATA